MTYQAAFKPSFFKDLAKVPAEMRARCEAAITQIIADPFGTAAKKLGGVPNIYRYRLGDYRVVYYGGRREKKILFLLMAHRKDVYRVMARQIK